MGRKKTNRERDVKIMGNGTTSFALMTFNTTFALIFQRVCLTIFVFDKAPQGFLLACSKDSLCKLLSRS